MKVAKLLPLKVFPFFLIIHLRPNNILGAWEQIWEYICGNGEDPDNHVPTKSDQILSCLLEWLFGFFGIWYTAILSGEEFCFHFLPPFLFGVNSEEKSCSYTSNFFPLEKTPFYKVFVFRGNK